MHMFKWHVKSNEVRTMRTDFLFMSPHPWLGFARLLDIGGTFDRYNVSRSDAEADAHAMYADWCMVGEDLRDAARHCPREAPTQLPLPLK